MCCRQERITRNGNVVHPAGQEKKGTNGRPAKALKQRIGRIRDGRKKFAVIKRLKEKESAEAKANLEQEFQERKIKKQH